MSKTMIIADTCSDVPVRLTSDYDVEVLATTFLIDGITFNEGIDFSHENFYDILPASDKKIKNFYIPAAVYLDRYKNAAVCGFDNVLVITNEERALPMYNSAKEAVELFKEQNQTSDFRIELFDSKNYSMATGMLVLEAAKLAADGTGIDEIIEALKVDGEKMRMLVNAFYIPISFNDPTKYWRKWLTMKSYHPYPTVKMTGARAVELPIEKGDHSAFDQFFEYCKTALEEKKPDYAIGYATRKKEAHAIAMLLEEELGYPPIAVYKLGAISSYVASKAAISLCYKED